MVESVTTSAASFGALAYPFAVGMLEKLRVLSGAGLSDFQRARLRESIGVDIRKLGDMAVPAVRLPRISLKAHEMAHGLGVELTQQTWQSQPTFDPGRAAFHYEHMTTVSTVTSQLSSTARVGDMLVALHDLINIAWITKIEDARLTKLGYKSNRPEPLTAYEEAGITLLPIVPSDDLLDAAPLYDESDLLTDLRRVLDGEVASAQDLHEASCSIRNADWSTCDCRLGRLLAEDATTKLRVLDQLHSWQSPELLRVVAELLAIPYARTHPALRRHVGGTEPERT